MITVDNIALAAALRPTPPRRPVLHAERLFVAADLSFEKLPDGAPAEIQMELDVRVHYEICETRVRIDRATMSHWHEGSELQLRVSLPGPMVTAIEQRIWQALCDREDREQDEDEQS